MFAFASPPLALTEARVGGSRLFIRRSRNLEGEGMTVVYGDVGKWEYVGCERRCFLLSGKLIYRFKLLLVPNAY